MPVAYENPIGQDQFVPAENNAVGEAGQELTKRIKDDLITIVLGSIYRYAQARRNQNRRRVYALARLPQNWDSYGAPAPNGTSVANAILVLNLLESLNFDPTRILPSAEGGIGICFVQGDRYADIECSNEGEVLGIYYAGAQMPALLETDATGASISAALERIRNHIRG